MNRILVGLAACTFCSLAVAGNVFAKDGISPAYPPKPTLDLHNHNRAIAFGSVILANGGSDVTTWKKVDAHRYCMHPIPGATATATSTSTSTPIGTVTATAIGTSIDTSSDSSDDTTVPDIGLEPIDGGGSTEPFPFPVGPGRCSYTVMVTTHYELVECPDGRAYVTRSGEGVDVESATEGSVFGWGEAVACGPDNGPFDRLDKDRPLEIKNITKTMK